MVELPRVQSDHIQIDYFAIIDNESFPAHEAWNLIELLFKF